MSPFTLETVRVFHDERLREAEAERLVREALADRAGSSTSPLAWVGKRMIELGNSLIELAGEDSSGETRSATISKN